MTRLTLRIHFDTDRALGPGKVRLLELVRDGCPIYAWPFEQRHVWRTEEMPLAGRVLERVTRPR